MLTFWLFVELFVALTFCRRLGTLAETVIKQPGFLGSWLIAKRTLIVLNHTRVLRAIFAALSRERNLKVWGP